ncbi:hypothetical protein [Anaerovibrio sp.]|uniref:hypothetical protein n=1 Tax=Anaerovibrio sp. TaxID=1872532 RepID=UPI00388F209D
MNILKFCLVAVLVFWLISEFAPENVSAITSMMGIAVAVVAMIMYNKKHNNSNEESEGYDDINDDRGKKDLLDKK